MTNIRQLGLVVQATLISQSAAFVAPTHPKSAGLLGASDFIQGGLARSPQLDAHALRDVSQESARSVSLTADSIAQTFQTLGCNLGDDSHVSHSTDGGEWFDADKTGQPQNFSDSQLASLEHKRIAFLAKVLAAPDYTSLVTQLSAKTAMAAMSRIAKALGGDAISCDVGLHHGLSPSANYQKTFEHPKTGEPVTRYFTITAPNGLSSADLRHLKATLKIGNPRSYGTPGVAEVPLSAKGSAMKDSRPDLDEILNNNYVITIRNTPDAKFGAMAVLHINRDSDSNTAYIGQVVNGPRDPMAGANKPMRGSELDFIVKGGGTLAVTEVLTLAAELGFDQARLYTDRAALGERRIEPSNGHPQPTFYDKFGESLGLDVFYRVVNKATPDGVKALPVTTDDLAGGQVGQATKSEYHYTYAGLEKLRSSSAEKAPG